jgi:hypothetical protein
MPEEALQELMVNTLMMEEAAAEAALPHGEMPGGLPGDNFVQLNFPEEAGVEDVGPASAPANASEAIPAADRAPPVPGDDEEEADEDEDLEEVGTFMQAYCSSR